MKCVADTNIYLAVALDEPEKPWLVEAARGRELLAPTLLPYELTNALAALVKRKALTPEQAISARGIASAIAVELVEIDHVSALSLAAGQGIFGYDACFLQCALEQRCPLLTLDQGLQRIADKLNIQRVVKP